MILLFVIVGDNTWTLFPKCSLGISIISVAWKLIQEFLVMNDCIVKDIAGKRQTPCEKFFCKTREDSHHIPTHQNPTHHNPTQNTQIQSISDQTQINTGTINNYHGNVMNINGNNTYHGKVVHINGNIQNQGGTF